MNGRQLGLAVAFGMLPLLAGAGERISLDLGWEFAIKDFPLWHGKVGMGVPQPVNLNNNGISDVAADSNGWERVDVPHDWALALPLAPDGCRKGIHAIGGEKFGRNAVAWYRRRFDAVVEAGGHAYLEFDGVYRDAQFWLNGIYLGRNDSGYIGRRFDVSDLLEESGTNNFLAVRVNAQEDEGWWYDGAGIYRHVWLVTEPADGIVPDSVYIRLKELRDDCAEMAVDYETFDAGKTQMTFTVAHPHLWSPDDPFLHTLELKGNRYTYGIRTVVFDPERGLLVNGRRVPVQGVCCHQDHAGVGVAVPDALQDYRVRRLKAMGVNAYRTSHNPPSPELLDACDRQGVMVLDETRAFSSSDDGLDQLRRLILRDRNHPSVIAWSFGNEEHNVQGTAVGRRMAASMRRLQRTLDPARVCTYSGNNGKEHGGANESVDVRGVNYIRLVGLQGELDAYHSDHPSVPVWGSEEASTLTTRGGEANFGDGAVWSDFDVVENRPYPWALTAEEWTTETARHPWYAGAFVWTGFDYRGECSWPAVNCSFGAMDLCGFPKNNFWYYRARWTDEDVLHVYPHWNRPRTNLWVNTNCDAVELFVNGNSCGRQVREKDVYRLSFPVRYEPGEVVAKGVRNGRPVEFRLATTGRVADFRMEPDRTVLTADGSDATVVNLVAVDDCGREVPDGCGRVFFSCEGEGRILGVGNGDPVSHEPDVCRDDQWSRIFFNGRCQVVLAAATRPGSVCLSAWLDPSRRRQVKVDVVARTRSRPENVPDVMKTFAGKEVRDLSTWQDERRPELLARFASCVFGLRPAAAERAEGVAFRQLAPTVEAMQGKAVCRRMSVDIAGPRGRVSFPFVAFVPKSANPVPATVLICNRPARENLDPSRTLRSDFWPAEDIVARGFAAIAFATEDVAADSPDAGFDQGVFSAYQKSVDRDERSWGTLSAWAWAASRVMDWIGTEGTIDAKKVVLVGHSRGGKTALWAGATDDRFAIVCANDSGCAGAKLNHIDLPESQSIAHLVGHFPHWFCRSYRAYAGRDRTMDFDQHELIALIAPRRVAVASATEDAGTEGEWWAAKLASPVWRLWGLNGLTDSRWPLPERPQQDGFVAYHLRTGHHGLERSDWRRFLDFAERGFVIGVR